MPEKALSGLQAVLTGRLVRVLPAALWFLTLMAPFVFSGALAWSAGLLYISYDIVLILLSIFFTSPLLRTHIVTDRGSRAVKLAVVIAARNEASVLATTVAALLHQADPPDRILIVDDGSTDNTSQVLGQRFGLSRRAPGLVSKDHPVVHSVRIHQGGKANALNKALTLLE